jgi:uncharacterized protein
MIWDETKRRINLEKHRLDFADAGLVLSNRYRLEFESVRNGQIRRQTFAYVAEVLTVLGNLVAGRKTTHHQLSQGSQK